MHRRFCKCASKIFITNGTVFKSSLPETAKAALAGTVPFQPLPDHFFKEFFTEHAIIILEWILRI